ncbi:MAG TPA: DUF2905 domain-containing protein [Halanaerobiales bacterium]|nr:DUF2905 domain-containing protein [Halanaerobiales bacterium]
MNSQFNWGKFLIYIGLIIAFIGFLINTIEINFNWFGNLPGDIRIERENFKLLIPITSLLIITIILNLIIYIIRLFM